MKILILLLLLILHLCCVAAQTPEPSPIPTVSPTTRPTHIPSTKPTHIPTPSPTSLRVPTFAPSTSFASGAPTPNPSAIPTKSPASNAVNTINFYVNQTIVGVTKSQFDGNSAYSLTIQETVAQIIQVSYTNIMVNVPVIFSQSSVIVVSYTVLSTASIYTTTNAISVLNTAVANGQFTYLMNANAINNNAIGLTHANATSTPKELVPSYAPTPTPTTIPTLPPVKVPTEIPTYILNSPTPNPSPRPSKQPGVPTRAPTALIGVSFTVSQTIYGFNFSAFTMSQYDAYILTIEQTVAFSINSPGIVTSGVTVISNTLPTGLQDRRLLTNRPSQSLFSSIFYLFRKGEREVVVQDADSLQATSVSFVYSIVTSNAIGMTSSEQAFTSYAMLLNESVSDGVFESYLRVNAAINEAGAMVQSVGGQPAFTSVSLPTAEPTLAPVLPPTPDIAGTQKAIAIAVGVLCSIVVVSSCLYSCFRPCGYPYDAFVPTSTYGVSSLERQSTGLEAMSSNPLQNSVVSHPSSRVNSKVSVLDGDSSKPRSDMTTVNLGHDDL